MKIPTPEDVEDLLTEAQKESAWADQQRGTDQEEASRASAAQATAAHGTAQSVYQGDDLDKKMPPPTVPVPDPKRL